MSTIAVVAPRYTEVGGMQTYARRVVTWLEARDATDVVVISSHPGWRMRTAAHDGVPVILLGTWLTLSNTPVNPLWFWQLRRLFRRLGIDVVNAHSPVPFLADMAVLAAGRRPTVLHYHAGSLVKGVGGVVDLVLRLYEQFVLPRVFARATRLIAVSPVASAVHTGRATVIPPGVDTSVFRPAAVPGRAASIVFVGRLETTSRWKGVQVLVDAFAKVRAERPDVHLELVGDGDDVPGLMARAQALGVADAVRHYGALAPEGVSAVLQCAGVAVLPSLTEAESFGMTLIEAMAAGCPVVGSRVGGIPHVIRDGVDGLLVPPGDADALAQALLGVLSEPAYATRLAAAGRAAAKGTWDWRHQKERTMAEFALALDNGGGGR